MKVKKVWAVYFSATGTTAKTVSAVASATAEQLGVPQETWDITLPEIRREGKQFSADELVVFGTPVYAGRVPNVLLKDLEGFVGNGALAVPVSSYGNRHYDDGLIELRDILEANGFLTVAAAAFIGEHSFSRTLAANRPDEADLTIAREFGCRVGRKVATLSGEPGSVRACHKPIEVPGTPKPYGGYYQPRDRKGVFIDIRKVKPLTADNCDDCGLCARVCPMGSIDPSDVRAFTGICIKCGACIKKCPKGAKYYDDPGYLYHKTELEEGLTRRAEPEVFL